MFIISDEDSESSWQIQRTLYSYVELVIIRSTHRKMIKKRKKNYQKLFYYPYYNQLMKKRTSSIEVNYELLMDSLYEIKKEKNPELSFSEFCKKHKMTDQRFYILKKNPILWSNMIWKLKKLWLDVNSILLEKKI